MLNFKYFSTSSLAKMEMTVCDLEQTLYNFQASVRQRKKLIKKLIGL